ncbi:(deoxy)nucleoside triphosphate pyrophosphohydrolase [Mangrovibacterium sp.]|uniref:(deoxy)nucleoside triphosphate pyrophosphohydrolase n=1 Tax=Mangrovibacterium sp. TaxID=1961364 RepID=UPI00356300DE
MIDVCCALIFNENCLLSVQRKIDSDHPGQWEFPGGKLEPGETAVACIKREIREELNCAIEPDAYLFPVDHDYGTKHIRLYPFVAQLSGVTLNLVDHEKLQWLTVQQLFSIQWQEADLELIKRNLGAILCRMRHYNEKGREQQRPA